MFYLLSKLDRGQYTQSNSRYYLSASLTERMITQTTLRKYNAAVILRTELLLFQNI